MYIIDTQRLELPVLLYLALSLSLSLSSPLSSSLLFMHDWVIVIMFMCSFMVNELFI